MKLCTRVLYLSLVIETVGLVKLGPKLKLSSKKVRSLKHRKLTKPALDRSNFNKIASWI